MARRFVFPSDPIKAYRDINKRFFDKGLPEDVSFLWGKDGTILEDRDGTEFFHGLEDMGSVVATEGGSFLMTLNSALKGLPKIIYTVVGHEALHLHLGLEVSHGSKKWTKGVQQLWDRGFFLKVF